MGNEPIELTPLGNVPYYDPKHKSWSKFENVDSYLKRYGNQNANLVLNAIYKGERCADDIKWQLNSDRNAISRPQINAICNALDNMEIIKQGNWDPSTGRYNDLKLTTRGEKYRVRFFNEIFEV